MVPRSSSPILRGRKGPQGMRADGDLVQGVPSHLGLRFEVQSEHQSHPQPWKVGGCRWGWVHPLQGTPAMSCHPRINK